MEAGFIDPAFLFEDLFLDDVSRQKDRYTQP